MKESLLIYLFNCIILIIILVGMALSSSKPKIAKNFASLIIASLFFVIINGLSEMFDGISGMDFLLYSINTLSFLAIDLLILTFCSYLKELLQNNQQGKLRSFKPIYIIVFSTIGRAITVFILIVTGNLFSFVDGVYIEGKAILVPYIATAVIMVEFIVLVIFNYKLFTKKQLIVMLIYEFMPIPAILLELFTNIYSLTPSAITLSIILIYALIQDNNVNAAKEREQALEEASNKDLLSGLLNRRAYYNSLSNIQKYQKYGVMFCDINGLKYTNDHLGHTEGDKLIIKFANMLIQSFGYNNIFRISGDEFVVIYPCLEENDFVLLTNLFKSIVANNDNIAAIGYDYGTGDKIELLINNAEDYMYYDKSKNKSHHNRKMEE